MQKRHSKHKDTDKDTKNIDKTRNILYETKQIYIHWKHTITEKHQNTKKYTNRHRQKTDTNRKSACK